MFSSHYHRCGFSIENTPGLILAQVNAILNIIILLVCLLCYVFIIFKIRSVAKSSMKDKTGDSKYHKSARVMMIFIVSFVLQYWAITLYYSWAFIEVPPLPLTFLTVSFTNQGGLFNFFAYTYVRRKYQNVKEAGNAIGGSTVYNQSRVEPSVAPGKTGEEEG